MKELLEELGKALVDDPSQVDVQAIESDTAMILELRVAQEDIGKVIGKQGRIAKALRVIIKAVGVKEGKKAIVEIVD